MKKVTLKRQRNNWVLLVLAVLSIAITGTYILAVSHADTCDTRGSGKVLEGDDGTLEVGSTDGCTTGPSTATAFCTISNVSNEPSYASILSPVIAITNTGTSSIIDSVVTINNSMVGKTTLELDSIAPGKTYTQTLESYLVPYASTTIESGEYTATSVNPDYSCSAAFTLPNLQIRE